MGKLFALILAGLAAYLNNSYHLVSAIYSEADGRRVDVTPIVVFIAVIVASVIIGRIVDRPKKTS